MALIGRESLEKGNRSLGCAARLDRSGRRVNVPLRMPTLALAESRNMIRADAHPVPDLLHRHGSRVGDRFAEKAGVRGSRCWIRTSATPGCGGRWRSRSVKASSPPADAPTPTTGNEVDSPPEERSAPWSVRETSRLFRFGDFMLGLVGRPAGFPAPFVAMRNAKQLALSSSLFALRSSLCALRSALCALRSALCALRSICAR